MPHVKPPKPLFDSPQEWRRLWTNMPEFRSDDQKSWQAIKVHFRNRDDRDAFAKLVNQKIGDMTKSLWYPQIEIKHIWDKRWDAIQAINPKYPVYVISKGRWKRNLRLTSRWLDEMMVPHYLVVEPQEYENYAEEVDPRQILTLPFSNLGQGSIPARNWVWEHAKESGAERHWILDDNIDGFWRSHENVRIRVKCGNIFRAAEDFVDRFENVAIAGFQYYMFAPDRKMVLPAYALNTRVYSCILIKNDLPFKWRGRYNEDTDLSLRVLKAGWCTILFNAFLAKKMPTMTMKGGNTDELYQDDGRLKMAEALCKLHPDVSKIARKWGRWQHQVNYSKFRKNKLVLKKGIKIPTGVNNYGMELAQVKTEMDFDSEEATA